VRMNNQRAVARTLRALRDTGRIERVDAAVMTLVLTTAHHLDNAEPGTTESAAAARAHLAALGQLMALDNRTEQGNAFLERITTVRDT
jgi:hypothetical protein